MSMVSQRPFQRLQPLSLLAQLISRQVDGCLQVVSGSTSWLLYLNQGKLAFATNSTTPFDRLDQHLVQMSEQIPALGQVDRSQLRAKFNPVSGPYLRSSADYQAIRWLIDEHFLDAVQATKLIEALAKDVLKPFLSITEGIYELIDKQNFVDYPTLCQLDLRPLVEQCHLELRQQAVASGTPPLNRVGAVPPSSFQGSSPESPEPTVARSGPSFSPSEQIPFDNPVPPSTQFKIACIDDSPTILQAISSFLNDSSVSVLMINDPVKALMQIVRSKPHVILLDVGMPNLDGYELCALLRRHPSFKQTPIIMVTGHTGFIDRAKAKLVGASGYLTKPFTQTDLVKTVFKYLS